jgi:hypothetical protein
MDPLLAVASLMLFVVLLLAQLKLFSIDKTLKSILEEVRIARISRPSAESGIGDTARFSGYDIHSGAGTSVIVWMTGGAALVALGVAAYFYFLSGGVK